MPLLTSPIDGSPMKQINRYGIEIDVCPTSGGIWLDRGELEKLMAILKDEAMNEPAEHRRPAYNGMRHSQQRYEGDDYDDDDDDDDYARDYRHKDKGRREHGGRRHGKMSRIMDIFDF